MPLPLGTPTSKVESVSALLEDAQGRLWLNLSGGVGYWDGQTLTRLTEEGGGGGLLEDTQGVSCWSAGRLQCYGSAQGLSNDLVVPLALDGAGQVWVGTQGGGLCRFEGERFFTLTKEQGLPHHGVYTVYEDGQGRLWVGTYAGVCCYDGNGFSALVLDTDTDQWRNLALAMHQDRQGQMWFVCFRGDIRRYDGQEVVTVHRSEGRWGHIHTSRAIVEDGQGRLWFASGDPGLRCWEQGALRTYTTG